MNSIPDVETINQLFEAQFEELILNSLVPGPPHMKWEHQDMNLGLGYMFSCIMIPAPIHAPEIIFHLFLFCFFPEIMLGQHFSSRGEVCNLFLIHLIFPLVRCVYFSMLV